MTLLGFFGLVALGCKRQASSATQPPAIPRGTGAERVASAVETSATAATADEAEEAETPSYTVNVEAPPAGRVGGKMVATITLRPGAGYKVNLEYPTKLSVNGPSAASPAQQTLGSRDAAKLSEATAVFKPGCTLAKAGDHAFTATFKFSVCTAKLCELKAEKLTWVASAR